MTRSALFRSVFLNNKTLSLKEAWIHQPKYCVETKELVYCIESLVIVL